MPANFERIEELIKTAKRIHRDKVISQWIIGFFSTLIAVTVGAFIIAGVVLVMALAIFGGFGGNLFGSPFRAKVSRTGNVWVGIVMRTGLAPVYALALGVSCHLKRLE